jgi:lipopolysaccharide/colanic/teichoic acid biosynthesis glycosyltransferase
MGESAGQQRGALQVSGGTVGTLIDGMATTGRRGHAGRPQRSVRWRVRRVLLVGWDAASWAIALTLALALRYEFDLDGDDVADLVSLIIVAVVAQVLVGGVLRVYRGHHCVGTLDDAVNTTMSITLSGIVVFLVNFALHPQSTPRSVAIIAAPIALMLAVGSRMVVRLYRDRRARPDPNFAQRVIIFGAAIEGQQVLRAMLTDPMAQFLPVAFLDDDPRHRRLRISGVAVQGTSADLAEVLVRWPADVLVITGHDVDDPAIREMSHVAAELGLEVKVLAPFAELLRPVPAASLIPTGTGGAATAGSLMTRLVAPMQSRAKRFMDITLSVMALLIALPLLIGITVLLKVTTGEVLYRAKRVGVDGEVFTMFKFSTMRPGDDGPRLTRTKDPRITPIGRWLRASKLNELPQIINVLKGDMSLVGPRPEDPRYAAFYSPEQRRVLSVRPGLTSLAFLRYGDEQAYIERAKPADIESFYLNELLPEKLDIELQYISNWTMRGDFRILARTMTELLT